MMTMSGITWVLEDDEKKRALLAQRMEVEHLPSMMPCLRADIVAKKGWNAGIFDRVVEVLKRGYVTEGEDGTLSWTGPRSSMLTLHGLEMQRRWMQIGETLKTGKPAGPLDPEFLAILTGTMRDSARNLAPYVTQYTLDHLPEGATRGLDVGGSHGLFSEALLQRREDLSMTVVDVPAVIAQVTSDSSRLKLVGGSMLDGALLAKEEVFDFACMIRFVHMHSLEEVRTMLTLLRPRMKAGGLLFVVDTMRGLSQNADIFSINMAVNTASGDTYSLADMEAAWMNELALVDVEAWPHDDRLGYVATTWRFV